MAVFMEAMGVRIAFGLIWKQVDEKHERSQLAALLLKHRAQYQIRWAGGQSVRYGVASQGKSTADSRNKTAVLSGAVLFASQVGKGQNALLVTPIDTKASKYAVVALVDGAPYLDLVLAANHVRERVESLKQEGHGPYRQYGSHPDFVEAAEWNTAKVFEAFAGQATMSKAVIRRPLGKQLAIGAVMLAAVAGTYTWDHLERERVEREEAEQMVLDPVAAYKASLQQALARVSIPGAAAFDGFWGPLAERQTTPAGGAIEKIVCNRTACVEDWSRLSGTNDDLIAQLPQGARYELGAGKLKDDTIRVIRDFKVRPTTIDPNTLPARNEFVMRYTSQSQRRTFVRELTGEYELKHTLETAKVLGNASGVPGALIVSSGTFEVTGPVGLMKETLTDLAENMSVDEISLDTAGGVVGAKFTVKGVYYVKN